MERSGLIEIVGIGPGSPEDMTFAAREALSHAEVVVGYKGYMPYVEPLLGPGAECIATGMRGEQKRAQQALECARDGRRVCVISSGDAGIYGMASLIYELRAAQGVDVEVQSIPGLSAFQKAASLLGAPMGHDFCVISLSDLMTPWATIERRIVAAAQADFVTAVYNPHSQSRYWQLDRLRELFLETRAGATPVGVVRNAGRPEQRVQLTTLEGLKPEETDMFTVVIIGNSQSYTSGEVFITPRGYTQRGAVDGAPAHKVGQSIMIESFSTILRELRRPDIPLGRLWPLLHTIHATADFEMERLLRVDEGAVETLYEQAVSHRFDTIITDVTMVSSGIRQGALTRLGLEAKCYLHDARTPEVAEREKITRAQAGIRLAVEEHPNALFAIGNAPTALMELCRLIYAGKATPVGVVAAPVGFVHVEESKQMLKPFTQVPKLIIEGRKGGSPLAATLVNAILTFDDAQALLPGRDV